MLGAMLSQMALLTVADAMVSIPVAVSVALTLSAWKIEIEILFPSLQELPLLDVQAQLPSDDRTPGQMYGGGGSSKVEA